MNLFNNLNSLQRSLDAASLRQRLISNNIANVDTPGYKTMEISFKDILNAEKSKYDTGNTFQGYRTDPRHLVIGSNSNSVNPKIVVQNNTSVLNNGNNVDVEYEMTKMAENSIWYNSLTQIMNKEFSILRYIITEGRR